MGIWSLGCLGALVEMTSQEKFKGNWHYFDINCEIMKNGRLNIILTHIKDMTSYQTTF